MNKFNKYLPKQTAGDYNFFDNVYSLLGDIVLYFVGQIDKNSQTAYSFYRNGLSAQSQGKYSIALKNYYQALQFECDDYDRSYILYNIGLLFEDLGAGDKAINYYCQALEMNPTLVQALNNISIVFYNLSEKIMPEDADLGSFLLTRAEEYWTLTVKLAPNNYLEAERWLKIRSNK